MRTFLWAILAIVTGSVLGLGMTVLSILSPPDFGVVRSGAWLARTRLGTNEADPYSRALLAMRGEIPLGSVEGLSLTATTDSLGHKLSGDCVYRISGHMPATNFWTLTVVQKGASSDGTMRTSLTSSGVQYAEKGGLVVRLAADVQAGNWLPLSRGSDVDIALRLYETQASTTLPVLERLTLPEIVRESCP